MRESGVGRVLVASLHQAIADILPARLVFYESWLTPEGLRDGTIGLAPLYAVLSFLRQEGDAYGVVTAKAGAFGQEEKFTVELREGWNAVIVQVVTGGPTHRLALQFDGVELRTAAKPEK